MTFSVFRVAMNIYLSWDERGFELKILPSKLYKTDELLVSGVASRLRMYPDLEKYFPTNKKQVTCKKCLHPVPKGKGVGLPFPGGWCHPECQ